MTNTERLEAINWVEVSIRMMKDRGVRDDDHDLRILINIHKALNIEEG